MIKLSQPPMRCTNCLHYMKGIYSYDIRDVCSPCGGYAIGVNGEELKPIKVEPKKKRKSNGS